jgi:hypothetical protein
MTAAVTGPLTGGKAGSLAGNDAPGTVARERLSVTTLVDRVAFCISTTGDLKISSEYGVEFKADRQNGKFWSEPLPKVVTGPPYYFDLPLQIELKTRGNARERRISLNLGACCSATNTCVPITFEVNAPMTSQGLLASYCSAPNAKTSFLLAEWVAGSL